MYVYRSKINSTGSNFFFLLHGWLLSNLNDICDHPRLQPYLHISLGVSASELDVDLHLIGFWDHWCVSEILLFPHASLNPHVSLTEVFIWARQEYILTLAAHNGMSKVNNIIFKHIYKLRIPQFWESKIKQGSWNSEVTKVSLAWSWQHQNQQLFTVFRYGVGLFILMV